LAETGTAGNAGGVAGGDGRPDGRLAGARRRARRLCRAARGAWFDWRAGVETSRRVTLPDHVGDRHGYEAADVWQLPKVLRPREVDSRDVLVDVGAGKGRVLLYALRRYSFRRVVGVEVSPRLAAVARANVRALPPRQQARVSVVEADVASWPVPDDATVFHLFNPFHGDTFRAFLMSVVASQRRRRRPIRLLYTHGHQDDDLRAAGFEPVRSRPRYALYLRRPGD
jgi:SAM-dependent methyltransferase